MGQIANQMFLEWCHRTAQKIGENVRSRKAKKQKPEDAGKKERR